MTKRLLHSSRRIRVPRVKASRQLNVRPAGTAQAIRAANQALAAEHPARVNFYVTCPHCGRNLEGEEIVQSSRHAGHAFFYTSSDHQLAYAGLNLEAVHCMGELP